VNAGVTDARRAAIQLKVGDPLRKVVPAALMLALSASIAALR